MFVITAAEELGPVVVPVDGPHGLNMAQASPQAPPLIVHLPQLSEHTNKQTNKQVKTQDTRLLASAVKNNSKCSLPIILLDCRVKIFPPA